MATGGPDTCVATYEELRNRVVAGAAFGSHFGLVLLLREGVAAWMSLCSTRSVTLEPEAIADRRAAAGRVPDEIHASVVQVLASMALRGHGEMSA